MTLDDLVKISKAARWDRIRGGNYENTEEASVCAVVRALRDEIKEIGFQEEMPFDPAIDFLNEILASSEGGQAAGEATRADNSAPLPAAPAFHKCAACQPTLYSEERCRTSGCEWSREFTVRAAPFAPAPDVCEWKMNAKGWWVSSCDTRYSFRKTARQKLTNCQLCNAPIKFTEAQR